MTRLKRKMKKIHFVGVGGIGMSGLAELLAVQGFEITGSDMESSQITMRLNDLGCEIWKGHDSGHLVDADAVVFSSAIDQDNVEILEAKKRGIPVIRRAEMLAELMRLKEGIAIGGTHGKTTTTSLIGHLVTAAGLDPTVIVGGVLRGLGTNARLGGGELLIAEADEYDRSFLKLTPTLAVITALEEEHLDTYGTYENLQEAFINFANSVPFYGMVIICCDDPNLTEILPEISRPVMTYGFSPHADLRGDKIHLADISRCEVYHDGQQLGTMEIPIPGKHNLSNALAAVAVARELEIPFEKISEAFKSFEGVKRRFELRGSVKGINIYDDYAHHPTEVSMTLNAAKKVAKNRIVAVFQPHLYSRTQAFSTEFAQSLMVSDLLIVTDIYPAREKPIEGVNAGIIVDKIKQYGHKNIHYVPNREDIAQFLVRLLEEGDTVITLGAGNIYQASDELLSLLGEGN